MMASSVTGRVLVTGASGYLATHIVQLLLKEGHQVRGTVRNLKNETKVKPLYSLCTSPRYPLELVEAELSESECWKEAVKDCEYVLHVASPFPLQNPKHEDEVIKPAVDGTLHVLQACQESGTVKRVVLTSSVAAISNGFDGNAGHPVDKPYTEKDWTDPERCNLIYIKSKVLAERAAWNFIEKTSDDNKFELAVINPGFIMGPVICGSDCSSLELPKMLLERAMPALAHLYFHIVDVRDVARAHLNAMTIPEAAGNRHLVIGGSMWVKDMALVIKKEFQHQGYNIPTIVAPKFFIWLNSLFDANIRAILPSIGVALKYETNRMKEVLSIQPVDLNTTIIDMCYNLIERGFVKKTKQYKGIPSSL